MIEKTNVLPVGSMITVRFASEGGRETIAVIVGHLSLRKDRQCFSNLSSFGSVIL